MRKLRFFWFTFVVVVAFSAVTAATALAAPEWLDNGALIATPIAVLSELMNPMLFEDSGVPSTVECMENMGENEGTVGALGADETTKWECLLGLRVSGPCESTKEVLITPLLLPWASLLELEEPGGVNMYYDLVGNAATHEVGFSVLCFILGTDETDTCVGPAIRFLAENDGVTGTVLLESDALTEADALLGLCTGLLGSGAPNLLAGSDTLVFTGEPSLDITVSG